MFLRIASIRSLRERQAAVPRSDEVFVVFFSVDVEASGTVAGFYDLLSIGAVTVSRGDDEYRIDDDEFYVELKPIHRTFDPESMRVNGLDLARLEKEGLHFEEAALRFAAFVKAHVTRREPAIFVGYCAHFDWAFVSDLFKRAKMTNPFSYKAIDLRSMAYGMLPYDWHRIGHTRLLQVLEMQPLAKEDAHHALADARHQAEMLIHLLAHRSERQRTP